jgi:hypothetical protein
MRIAMSKAGEKAKKIIHFYCRPCAEYHLKTHAHYRAMLARKRKRAAEKSAQKAVEKDQQ